MPLTLNVLPVIHAIREETPFVRVPRSARPRAAWPDLFKCAYSSAMDIAGIVGLVGGSISIGQSALQFLGFLKEIAGSDVIAAYFSAEGKRLHGDEQIDVLRIANEEQPDEWWYQVKELPEYVFTRIAVGADAAVEQFGTEQGKRNADARYWRWIAPVLPGRIYGGTSPNALVEFLIIGYKPKALIDHFSSRKKK